MSKLELPQFTSPDMAVARLKDRLDQYVTKLKQGACVNANITSTAPSFNEDDKTVFPGDVIFAEVGCKNARRVGSKYCQTCSDSHHGITPAPSGKIEP